MGYACPVCSDPQADATHLANHLAFTALARGGDHEAYLDDHVPDWEELDEATLGERLTEVAEETDYPQVFEDTTGQDHDHQHARDHQPQTREVPDAMLREAEAQLEDTEMADSEAVLEEAMKLTRQRHADDEDAADSETE